jgi:glyoxylase-like metal-dependent hydrolase (beta-lactamase superfamily II)
MTTQTSIHAYGDQLYRVPLPVPIDGFEDFISAWVHTADPVCVIDTGPSVSSSALLAALDELGVKRLDYILLTHIHIDHAGGVRALSDAFPEAPVVCHPKGIAHVVEPERLWQGSLKTLGRIARAYGPIEAVPQERLCAADRLQSESLAAVPTPGHAAHHFSYLLHNDILFAGEAGGNCLSLDDGGCYLRPATPPRFFIETHLQSLDRLIALNPQRICYGHVGMQTDAGRLLKAHRDQLLRWEKLIRPFFTAQPGDEAAAMAACRDHLLRSDPLLAGLTSLPADVQERERGFIINSIKGYWGYLAQHSV